MSAEQSKPAGRDLGHGVPLEDVPDGGMIGGHVGDDAVLLARRRNEYFAIGATCSHYGGPLAEGLIVDDTVRCPWHHACFSLRTGEALAAPAFNPMPCWRVETRDGKVFVGARIEPEPKAEKTPAKAASPNGKPERLVIVGGRRGLCRHRDAPPRGFGGSVSMLSADDPYLRPAELLQGLPGRKCPED
jgi:nitrite reductase/ring-hydroxylating ferredoxin subunit